jgi:OFA family oxalate/formate antiporter-like MFS transporter
MKLMDEPPRHRPKFFYGWVITGLVLLNLATAYGAQYSFGVFFPSLVQEFQWSRQDLAGAFSLYCLLYNFLGIFLGRLADRLGPRTVLVLGSFCLGTGIGLISQVEVPWHLYLAYGLLAPFGMCAAYMTGSPTVVKWFIEKRGMALGLALSGMGWGIIIFPPITGILISAFGWRRACILLGAAVFSILFTSALFLVSHPERLGLTPDGRPPKAPRNSWGSWSQGEGEIHYSMDQVIRTGSFWLLNLVFFLGWLFIFFPLVHLVILADDLGLSRESAYFALALLGLFSNLGRIGLGSLSDRLGRKPMLIFSLGLQVFSWLWLLSTHTAWMLYAFALFFGLSYGGLGANFPAITGDYFGRRNAAALIGAILTLSGWASAIGRWIGGMIYDVTHSYTIAFQLAALCNFMGLIFILFCKPPRVPSKGATVKER